MARTKRTEKPRARRKVGRKLVPEERAILPAVKSLCDEISATVIRASSSPLDQRVLLQRRTKATELLGQLIQYSVQHPAYLPAEEGRKIVMAGCKALIEQGLQSETEADKTVEQALRKPRGRPVVDRYLAARVLGLKLENPKLTYQEIAGELRPADYPIHVETGKKHLAGSQPFRMRLRRDVTRLRSLLRRIESFLSRS